MAKTRQDKEGRAFSEMTIQEIEEIRRDLMQGKGNLAVNQQIIFSHAAALPPAKKIAMYVAGWTPMVLFPAGVLVYFFSVKIALFLGFLAIFWVGMGRKYAQRAIIKQCLEDAVFLKYALTVNLVNLV